MDKLIPGISVIICCYNSGWIIQRTLEAMKLQKVREGLPWELIVVDNRCADDTVQIVRQTMEGSGVDFTIVEETEPGLAYARRRGVMSVKYDTIVFCDDDNLFSPTYINAMYDILLTNPQIGAAGGMGIIEFQSEPSQGVTPSDYASGSQKEHENEWLYGAGVTMRTALLRDIYAMQEINLVGRKGNLQLCGEEVELEKSMILRGYKLLCTDDQTFIHVVKSSRLNTEYLSRASEGGKLQAPVLDVYSLAIEGKPFSVIVKRYYGFVKGIIWSYLFFWRSNAKEVRTYCSEQFRVHHYWGILRLWKIYCTLMKVKNRKHSIAF